MSRIEHFEAELFFDPGDEELRFLPEGPRLLQHSADGRKRLGWVAIQHGAESKEGSLNVLDLETRENRRVRLPGRPGFFAETTKPDVVLVGLERELVYCDWTTGTVERLGLSAGDDPEVIINDGMAVDCGVLFGTKHLKFNQPVAALYLFDFASWSVRQVVGGQYCSNGKVFARDGEGVMLLDIDSIPKLISHYRFDHTMVEVRDKRVVVAPEALPGFPDGMRPAPRIDGDESVVVAFYNPEAVADGVAREFRVADGAVLSEWRIPGSPRVTCPEVVNIGGEVKVLFTTAVEGMAAEGRAIAPHAGKIFMAPTGFDAQVEIVAPPLVPYRGTI